MDIDKTIVYYGFYKKEDKESGYKSIYYELTPSPKIVFVPFISSQGFFLKNMTQVSLQLLTRWERPHTLSSLDLVQIERMSLTINIKLLLW